MAPDFVVTDIHGVEQRLSSFRGKKVLLHFWASWCEPCMEELPEIERLWLDLKGKDLVVLSVAIDDDKQSVIEVEKSLKLSFPILADDGAVKTLYRVGGVPESFIIDREGKLVLFPDVDGIPTVRISGARDWSNQTIRQRLLQ
jgi:thiol-disulfide isomerase/thioredoxin